MYEIKQNNKDKTYNFTVKFETLTDAKNYIFDHLLVSFRDELSKLDNFARIKDITDHYASMFAKMQSNLIAELTGRGAFFSDYSERTTFCLIGKNLS